MRKQIVHNDPLGAPHDVVTPVTYNYIDIIRGSRDEVKEE